MTDTAARVRRLGLPHARARAGAVLLASAGVAFGSAAAGLALAPRVAAVLGAWLFIAAAAGVAAWLVRRARRRAAPPVVGRLVEAMAGIRAGSVVGLLAPPTRTAGASADLLRLADRRAAALVEGAAPAVGRFLWRGTRASLGAGACAAAVGAALFVAASPGGAPAAAFWHPLRALADARAPVRLSLDRAAVRRGDTVTATIEVPAGARAVLWTRGPGEPWRPAPVALDSLGRAVRRLGPLDADLYLRATSGGRRSAERKVTVALPAFLAGLELIARYPAYLARPDEPLVGGPDTIPLPEGTAILTSGTASVPLKSAAWRHGARRAPLAVAGSGFSGRLAPLVGAGIWVLDLATADGSLLEGDVPELRLRVVPDSAPVVAVPIPGRDTTLPLSLRQPLVVDARDDHGLTRLEVVSWRVSRTGKVGQAVRESLDVTVRAATRQATAALAAAGDSLAEAQRELGARTSDLAEQRSRDASASRRPPPGESGREGTLPFQATERAQAVAREQAALQQRVEQLSRAVEEIARAARAAGIDDTAFQARLREVQELLQRAVTPQLEQRLRELQDALAKLDPEAARQALERLAEAQQQLKAELERSQELFRRAAVEGALASLAADAEDLKRRQGEWNRDDAARPDSVAAARQRALAERADSLAAGIDQVAKDLGAPRPSLARPAQAARNARAAMQRAARAADDRQAGEAQQAGQQAEQQLEDVPDQLRGQRDSLAQQWRAEALAALDRALSETAALAERQERVAEALRTGEAGAATRSQQASIEEGTDAVGRQVREAAGKHALVSPQLEGALGFAKRQMAAAQAQLEEADVNPGEAAGLAEQAVDALNATALALARSRSQVSGAQSGSGFAEAVEQLARLARDQQGLNGQAQGLLPLIGPSGQAVLEQLRALAARQRALAEQLERLKAEGTSPAAAALAQEARELARQLEGGRLDQQTIRRQQQLYRRLLDAGRTLQGEEPDEKQERVSRAATGDSVHIPEVLKPGATGAGPKLRYPTWEELAGLTPEQRRLVLEYFRRLNAPAPR